MWHLRWPYHTTCFPGPPGSLRHTCNFARRRRKASIPFPMGLAARLSVPWACWIRHHGMSAMCTRGIRTTNAYASHWSLLYGSGRLGSVVAPAWCARFPSLRHAGRATAITICTGMAVVPLVARHLCREDGRDFIIALYFLHHGMFNIDTVEGEALSDGHLSWPNALRNSSFDFV